MASASTRPESPLVVIVGPTASGKTSLAIRLAQQYGGEIICADSRTVYRDMDIGTAKPTRKEQELVPHWALDIVSPGERFTAVDFKAYALQKVDEIRSRGHIPFLVGGTGLYIDSVVFDYEFGQDVDNSMRQHLESLSVDQLQEYCRKNNIPLPENSTNKRYLVRTIERNGSGNKRKSQPISTSIIVGIATNREVLRTRIEHRSEQIFDDGVVEEAIMLGKKYGWNNEAMTGNIYPLIRQYLDGVLELDDVKTKFVTLDWRLAKRQLTWLRRNPYIRWKTLSDAEHYLSGILGNQANP